MSAVRWVENSDGELGGCSDRMVTVTNILVPVDELRIGRALSCGQDGRLGTMWSDQDGSQEGGGCTGRVWLHSLFAFHRISGSSRRFGEPTVRARE